MSAKDRDRLVVLHQVQQEQLTVSAAARRLHLSVRQMRRVVRRFEEEGDASVVHALRERPSNRRLPAGVREAALAQAGKEIYRDFGPTLLSEHLARDPAIGSVHPATLRLWMIEEGLWAPTRRGKRHRKRRERRAAGGEMVLMDTSVHRWLEERSEEEMVLISMIDDATSDLHARFFPRDTGAANRRMIVDYLAGRGRMGALYTDRASHFEAHFRSRQRKEADEPEALTVIRRALDALDIELILALSPQAKGRVERLFKTLQDRLVKEMRVAGISSLEEANRFLEEVFLPFWQRRFTVAPRESADAHRPLPEGVDLLRLFAETKERVIRSDFTFRYRNAHFQIEAAEAEPRMPGRRVTLEHRLDGAVCYRWEETYLSPTALPEAPRAAAPEPVPPPRVETQPLPRKPAPGHPWRRSDIGRASQARAAAGGGPTLRSGPTPAAPPIP